MKRRRSRARQVMLRLFALERRKEERKEERMEGRKERRKKRKKELY